MSNSTGTEAADKGPGGLQSVDRALNVLELLARWGNGGVSELAAELDVHKSTAFRLLGALESHGLVEQTEERGKYRLGFGLVRLAGAVSGRMDITKQARPVAERLANAIGETVNIAVLREHYAINVDQALGPASVTTQNWVGQLTPLHATSSGKVLLAHVDGPERGRLVKAGGLPAFTAETITSPGELDKELHKILENGYATTIGEYEDGLNAVAVPVRDADGTVVAALSASGPSYRLTADRMEDLVPTMKEAGLEVSRRLGYIGPRGD
ncbi:IclR family transcriptional regulator [Dactylosporangium sp. NPDC005572]|uniref:IclR family transcriptional regulator n=1 Tax=Dactylosporangium sp. NPDC005572 TaxID=3156889 RepID=UPI0033BAFB80